MRTINIRPLSEELSLRAQNELNENPSKIQDDLDAIRIWLSKQQHIIARTDDQFLIAFLRGCKYSLERAKEKIDTYYTIRTAIPEFFLNRDPSNKKLLEVVRLGLTLPLPLLDNKTGARLFLIKQGAYDPHYFSIHDVMKVSYMITELMFREDDDAVISGQMVLVDLKGLSFAHIAQCSPTLIKQMTSSIQEAYPLRQKGIHFVNPTAGFDALYKIFCNFMSGKIKERIVVHNNFESLHQHVNKKLLPAEYGGDAGTIQNIAEEWERKLLSKRDWFLEEAKYQTDESKRIGKLKNGDILFGTQGSFRKLEVD